MKTKGKERVKDFNQRFSYLKNKIPTTILLFEEFLVAYYIKGLTNQIPFWVKRARKGILQEAFTEAIQVEKDIFFLKENIDTLAKRASTSHKKIENVPKIIATNSNPFSMFDMKKLLKKCPIIWLI